MDTARTEFTSIEGVRGTIRADSIWGNDAGNTLIGLIGADKLHGLDGADTLDGGDDNDTLEGARHRLRTGLESEARTTTPSSSPRPRR